MSEIIPEKWKDLVRTENALAKPGESEERIEAGEGPVWRGKPVLWAFFPFYFVGALGAVTGTIAELAFSLPLWTLGFLIFFVALMVTIPLPLQMAWTFAVTPREIRRDFSLFVKRSKSAPTHEATDVTASQGPIGRIFGFGTIRIDTAGTPFPGVRFWGVEDPFTVEKTVRKVIAHAAEKG